MDFGKLLTIKQSWDTFCGNHPRFPAFLNAVKNKGAVEGTEVLITVTYPDGQTMKAGLKLHASDIELYNSLSQLIGK